MDLILPGPRRGLVRRRYLRSNVVFQGRVNTEMGSSSTDVHGVESAVTSTAHHQAFTAEVQT